MRWMSSDSAPPHTSRPTLAPTRSVTVKAPGRLHLGFLDPSGSLGRRFGSLGLVIDGFATELTLSAAAHDRIVAATPAAQAQQGRVAAHLQALRVQSGCMQPLAVQLDEVLPAHAGFGSGTQLALAIGRAFTRWHRIDADTRTIARWLGRGLRSGVGIAGFDHGGLLLDGGPGADGSVAPLLARIAWPAAWAIVVVQDPRQCGLAGPAERHAMASLPAMPRTLAADICHQVLMRVLPGAADADFAAFAAGLTHMQALLGSHFAPAQHGGVYTSAAVGHAVQWLAEAAAGDRCQLADEACAASGQSSWGPTGFAILPSAARAQSLVDAARAAGAIDAALDVRIVGASSRGATLAEPFPEYVSAPVGAAITAAARADRRVHHP